MVNGSWLLTNFCRKTAGLWLGTVLVVECLSLLNDPVFVGFFSKARVTVLLTQFFAQSWPALANSR